MLVFFILWLRHFKNSGYIFTCGSLLLYILFQAVSIGVGYLTYHNVDYEVDLVMTSFVILPITACSYAAFMGIWISNDFSGYEHDYLQGKNFSPAEIEAYNKLGCCDKLKHGAWKPRTGKDCAFLSMILVNIVSIVTYLVATTVSFKPEYVGMTIALLVLVFETTLIAIWKYRATHFTMTLQAVVALLASVGTMLFWIVYITMDLLLDDEEPDYFKALTVLVIVFYFIMLIGSLLYMEYEGVHGKWRQLSCSFWILAGLTYLILLGIGAAAIYYTDYGLVGIIWISVCVYILLNVLLSSFRRIIDILFSIMFIVAGVILLLSSDNNS